MVIANHAGHLRDRGLSHLCLLGIGSGKGRIYLFDLQDEFADQGPTSSTSFSEREPCASPKLDFGDLQTQIIICNALGNRSHRRFIWLTALPSASVPVRYDNIATIAVLLRRGALVPMVQSADFPDLNDPASL
jgi:hypothetical protein